MKTPKISSKAALFSILLLTTLLTHQTLSIHACKKSVLRSFGMTGLAQSNTNNALCPGNKHNCCVNLDQMKVHKLWHKHVKNLVVNNHKINSAELLKVEKIVKDRKKLNFKELFKKYKEKKNPSKFFEKLYKEQEAKFEKYTHEALSNTAKGLKEGIKAFKKHILHLRKGFMCALCSQKAHTFIKPEENSVIYSADFCMDLITKNVDVLKNKYVDLIGYLVNLHHIVDMLFDVKLFDPVALANFEKFIPIIESCQGSKDLKTCAPLCSEFNLNKFTDIWDGEKIPIEFFLQEYAKIQPNFESEEKLVAMFKYTKDRWIALEKEIEAKKEAAKKEAQEKQAAKDKKKPAPQKPAPLPKVNLSEGEISSLKDHSFKIQFTPRSIKTHLTANPGPQVAKIEADNKENEEYRLYEMVKEPIKFSALEIKIEAVGIDLHLSAKDNNLETNPDQIIALIYAKGGEIKPLDETITDDVKAMLIKLGIGEIKSFVIDAGIEFDRFCSKKEKKPKMRPRKGLLNLVWPAEKKEGEEESADDQANTGSAE